MGRWTNPLTISLFSAIHYIPHANLWHSDMVVTLLKTSHNIFFSRNLAFILCSSQILADVSVHYNQHNTNPIPGLHVSSASGAFNPKVGLMLGKWRKQGPNIKPALRQHVDYLFLQRPTVLLFQSWTPHRPGVYSAEGYPVLQPGVKKKSPVASRLNKPTKWWPGIAWPGAICGAMPQVTFQRWMWSLPRVKAA